MFCVYKVFFTVIECNVDLITVKGRMNYVVFVLKLINCEW